MSVHYFEFFKFSGMNFKSEKKIVFNTQKAITKINCVLLSFLIIKFNIKQNITN